MLAGNRSVARAVGGGQVLASSVVLEQYRRLSGASAGDAAGGPAGPLQREVEGDCPIW